MDWTRTVWVVTGASSGIGRRTALDVAAAGATVCVAARREERLKSLVAEMAGADHSYHVTDVSDRSQVRRLARHVADRHGRVDVLVNNAGYIGPTGFTGADAIEEVDALMATNFFGAIYCTGELMDLLLESAPSTVVNVTSVAGRIAAPGKPAYTASKFALVGWSESLAATIRHKGIHVASVEPGFVPTEGFPQSEMVKDPLMKRILGTDAMVSKAIQDAVKKRKPQRVVPRAYYLAQIPEVVAPRLWRKAISKMTGLRDAGKDR
ncbi:MAG: SDR family oxidoreductase [Actinobacteria bacterium]|nr:SDR family oxidoreductase [Actinomycetota bacterium]